MPALTRITATVVIDVVIQGDEELDNICEDIHQQLSMVMVDNDWTGSVELSWEHTAPANNIVPIR
ncbi:MAG TPA: hypothetical protein VMT30_09470 [Candidatus Saccharimonadia bacterium]|nr:hypothetical protein [Candidatus Saccharimonadia bacterium]